MSDWATVGAVIVTALATIAIAVFAWRTCKVYEQIKGVMEETVHAAMRPVLLIGTPDKEPRYMNLGGGRHGWTWKLRMRNVGPGIAVDVRLHRVDMETEQRAEVLDPEINVASGAEREDQFEFDWPENVDPSTVGLDFAYRDVYGNEFVTELRGKRRRFRRV